MMPRLARTLPRSALLLILAAAAASAARGEDEDRLGGAFGAFLAGRFAVQRHEMATAAENFEQALRADPGVKELQTNAFLAALMAGRPETARLAAALPDNPLAQLVLADRDAKAGRWEAAEARFAALTTQQPLTQILRPLLLAWAQQGGGHTAAALGTLAPAIEGTQFRGIYELHAAAIADLAGQKAEAAQLYRKAATDYGPMNLRLGVILASWQARQGQVTEAQRTIGDVVNGNGELAIAQQALVANVSEPAIRNAADGIAEAYLAMAATLHGQGSDSAQFLLQLALEMRPDFAAAHILLADVLERAKRPAAALAALQKVPADDKLAAVVALRRARLLDETGQSEAADAVLDELAREHPDRPEPLAEKGDILRRKNRFAEAARAYGEAIQRLGTPSRANWPLFFDHGVALERAGDWPKAEAEFEYALRLAPDQASVLNYLAYSWAERGEHLDKARTMLERALTQRPNSGAIMDSLGWVLLREGDAAGAVSKLERAVELDPEDPVINAHLGDALAAVGRIREAEFQWRRALNLKPEAEDARKLIEKLEALPGSAPPATASVPAATSPR